MKKFYTEIWLVLQQNASQNRPEHQKPVHKNLMGRRKHLIISWTK